jgi:hypothetical protein
MAQRALLLAAMVSLLLAADTPTKDEPAKPAALGPANAPAKDDTPKPATLTWIGPAGGKWSDTANWKPAQLPGSRDTVIFDGALGKDTASVMDLFHIAKLEVRANYTQTITLQNDLSVDVLNMEGGAIEGTKRLIIWQRVAGQIQPATRFSTSYFTGGTIKAKTFAYGEYNHRLTFRIAKVPTLTPNLQANLTADAFTQMKWEANSMTVGGGKTITVYGSFDATSPGRIGNPTADWHLNIMTDGDLSYGKGKFDHGLVQSKGGTIYIEDVADAAPGGGRTFKPAVWSGRQEGYAKVELKGVLSEGPGGPEFTVESRDMYDLDLSKKPKLKGEALQKLYGQRGLIVTGTLSLPLDRMERMRVVVSSIHVEVTDDE